MEVYTCYCVAMATNLAISDELLNTALRVGDFKTKKDTVNAALQEFIEWRKQQEIIKLFGTIDYDPAYGYKKARNRAKK